MLDDDDAVVRTLRGRGLEVLHARWMHDSDDPVAPTLFDAQESDGRT